MQRKGILLSIMMLCMVVLTGTAFAWTGKADVDAWGKPVQFYSGGPEGYYIWQDDRGFHLWTMTRPGERHVFTGMIRTDGDFLHVRGHNLERGDYYDVTENGKNHFWFDFSNRNGDERISFGNSERMNSNKKIRFRLDTDSQSDGLNFKVQNAQYVDFELFEDGKPISHKLIRIGEIGWHPYANHFHLEQ
ncbi:MAG: hypothetical protein E6713_12250 [Sporomusaceae bacterium]|nr:hypothetical protein [Sporomusaceae bacterium]